jgi:sugar phosphate isomerase/epimerase
MNALVGYTGFVGSHLMREGMDFYNRKNLKELSGKSYNTLYCSALPAEKWKVNMNPEEDRSNMEVLMHALRTVKCDTFILISTVDVYDTSLPQCEDPDLYPVYYSNQPYGKHRREFEEWALQTFKNVYVFRLPALFGHGLKKNALYDMMHKNQVEKLRDHWLFHWYNLEWLWDDIHKHISLNHHIVNLVTPPISLSTVQTLLFPEVILSNESTPKVRYAISSKYGYSHSVEDVLVSMANYVRHKPRLLVSEIGWDSEVMFSYLKRYGIQQREIVPSKRNWNMQSYTNVYSAQSILYGVDIQIFKEQDRFLDILSDRMSKLSSVGTKIVVFGSPKQRLYSGEDAISLFRRVGDICRPLGIVFCVENNSRLYGGNWMCTLKETIEFVKSVNHPNIRVNLDTGSMMMEGETIVPDIEWIGHVQISFPHLARWQPNTNLPCILEQLQGYNGKISLEVLDVDFSSIDNFVKQDWLHFKNASNLTA